MLSLFDDLMERIDDLHFRFVPEISSTGAYTEAEYDNMRAFRLLSHAEIERYLEALVESSLLRMTTTIAKWRGAGTASTLVDQIVAYTDKQLRNELIKKNHGVRKDNILALLKPLGINGTQLDNVWLETMDAYGAIRGGFAHNSQRATRPVDPLTEQNLLYQQILPELKKLAVLANSIV